MCSEWHNKPSLLAQQALSAGTTLTHLLCPHCHASVLDATIPTGDHHCQVRLNKWPRTTCMMWGNLLASLAPELVADSLHVQTLPLVLYAILAILTNATLLPSFLE